MLRLLLGLAARVPGLNRRIVNRGTGGTDRASYCYGVWLKHLTLLLESSPGGVPRSVGELGPGDSLGVGLAALLSGAERYLALDVRRYADSGRNRAVLSELVELFRRRAPRPVRGWPDFDRHLGPDLFPGHALPQAELERTLAPERVRAIESALADGSSPDGGIAIAYKVPWTSPADVERESLDLVLSHSVLEHADDLDACYRACAAWLRPGGLMSHQIDFESHGLAKRWNGCWAYSSELYWRILAGRRDCKINRQPFSEHLRRVRALGFEVLLDLRSHRDDGIPRSRLAPRWRHLSDDDLTCSGAFLLARKPA